MPIVDACIVVQEGEPAPSNAAKTIANAIAATLSAAPGRVWVRLQLLPHSRYAENGDEVEPYPVFLRILHADPKKVEELEQEAVKLANAVGSCLGRSSELVHIEYAPSGRGRIAFGGRLLK
jgi:phenylpyruvate tautomerase PptA (4-oxalocrotonate tautomerase family)